MAEDTDPGFVVLAYENALIMKPLVEALHAQCGADEFVIYRQPFRWLRYEGDFHDGHVLSNCYEMFPLESVLDYCKLECRYSFEHAAIVHPPRPMQAVIGDEK